MEFIDEPLMSCSSSALLRRPPRCICFTARLCNFGFQPEALNRAFLDIFEELLVLQNFFSCKITPPHCKNRFCKSKGSPLWMLKNKFLQIKFLSKSCCGIWSFGFFLEKIFTKNIFNT